MWESIGERFCDVFVALIKFLSGRVPAFRGDDKLLGSSSMAVISDCWNSLPSLIPS